MKKLAAEFAKGSRLRLFPCSFLAVSSSQADFIYIDKLLTFRSGKEADQRNTIAMRPSSVVVEIANR